VVVTENQTSPTNYQTELLVLLQEGYSHQQQRFDGAAAILINDTALMVRLQECYSHQRQRF
jgi:hypothetical protein